MVWLRGLVTAAALLGLLAMAHAGPPAVLPALSFEDQEGATLDLGRLRGHVVVIVYGARAGLEDHAAWGRRLHARLLELGVYRADEPEPQRPVRILALAQMGGIPPPFRPVVRTFLRGRTPAGFSLYLDWEDRMGTLFGAHDELSTVVVADRDSRIRLVSTGVPSPENIRRVLETIRRVV